LKRIRQSIFFVVSFGCGAWSSVWRRDREVEVEPVGSDADADADADGATRKIDPSLGIEVLNVSSASGCGEGGEENGQAATLAVAASAEAMIED
jgi:hypothetical protein